MKQLIFYCVCFNGYETSEGPTSIKNDLRRTKIGAFLSRSRKIEKGGPKGDQQRPPNQKSQCPSPRVTRFERKMIPRGAEKMSKSENE